MSWDGLQILLAVFVAGMAAIVAGGFLVAYLVGRAVFPRHRGRALGLGLVGAVAGSFLVIATFFKDVWSPPPQLRIEVPAGFAHPDTILLEDARSETELDWRGLRMPFFGVSTTVSVPANGVLRVKSFGPLAGRGDIGLVWSDGSTSRGQLSGPGPSELSASAYVIYGRDGAGPTGIVNDEAVERYIRTREERR